MSQRTRARTTGAAPKPTKPVERDEPMTAAPPSKRGRRKALVESTPAAEVTFVEAAVEQAALGMSPDTLARALRAVATELERDPALARRVAAAVYGVSSGEDEKRSPSSHVEALVEPVVDQTPAATIGRTFHPSIVTGVASDLGSGVPDPFALRKRLGVDGLRNALESLRLGSLRAIIREYKLDPGGRLSKLNDVEKLRERIVQAAMERE